MGLALRYVKGVHPELKGEIFYFGRWLRKNYDFPIPLEIRLVNQDFIIDDDGTNCMLRW